MRSQEQAAEILAQARQTLHQFLLSEIELAMTFINTAASTSNSETHERNLGNALKGYNTALAFIAKKQLTPEECDELCERIKPLRAALQELGKVPHENST